MIEQFYDIERANTYKVLNALGQQVYTAFEVKTTHCSRNCNCCCCPSHLREFEISVRDNLNIEVARFQRPYKCNSCCFNLLSCSLQEMTVLDRAGIAIGSVKPGLGKKYFFFSFFFSEFSSFPKISRFQKHVEKINGKENILPSPGSSNRRAVAPPFLTFVTRMETLF